LEASRLLGADVEAPCGAQHICGKCRVRIVSDASHAGPWLALEADHISKTEQAAGYRLACAARVVGDLVVDVPAESRAGKQVIRKSARNIPIDLNPAVKSYHLDLKPPELDDPQADFERVAAGLASVHGLSRLRIDLGVLRDLPRALRQGGWKLTASVWMDQEIIRVQPGQGQGDYGLALDIGTTTIAAYMCDLATGKVVHTASMMNPQVKYGEDVLARIAFQQRHADGLARLSGDLIAGLNGLIEQMMAETAKTLALEAHDIIDMTIGGNTVMQHILLQLDPSALGEIPFAPVIHHAQVVKARRLGLAIHPAANVFVMPNVAGFVGGDTAGVIVAERPHQQEAIELIIDIGTNGELVMGNRDRLICTSCATGPALEGAQISHGMRAAPGAIERLSIDAQTRDVDYKVIGRDAWRSYSPAEAMQVRGICGSGILDTLAQLCLAGVVDTSGAFANTEVSTPRLRRDPVSGIKEFVLAWAAETAIDRDIVITQKDIRQVQLAKAAIYTGCKLLMRELDVETVKRVKIAGAFGAHIDRYLALVLGLLPDCPPEKVSSIGNAAGDGCRAALLDRRRRAEAEDICRQIDYVELTRSADFQLQLTEALHIPHMVDAFPHLQAARQKA
jgi:uncharacterized 2Fe-2S/4Fe-4S cluster protein (DUF4445 family)